MAGYATTTRSTLRTRVAERLLSTFWSSTELNAYINEALRVWNILTGYQRAFYTISIPSQTYYVTTTAVSANTIAVQRIDNGIGTAVTTHLDPLTLEGLSNMVPNYQSTPTGVATSWVQLGLNNFILYPIPTSSFNTTVYTLDRMTIPASDGDFIQVGEEDMAAIVDYIVFIARLKESGSEFTESVALLKNFLLQAAKYNSKIINSALYKRIIGVPYQPQQRPDALQQQNRS